MRTTIVIDDDILKAAKSLARSEDMSIGKALSMLARKGLNISTKKKSLNGIPLFNTKNSAPITPEEIKKLDEDY